jgi:hypothetical protein
LATLAWPISMPSLRSSPWILGAPHNHETEALRDSASRASRIRLPTEQEAANWRAVEADIDRAQQVWARCRAQEACLSLQNA